MERVKKIIDRYRARVILISVLVFLIHFSKLGSAVIGIDTENLIKEQRKFYRGWLDIGRYGLVFLKGLFGGYDQFNPYFAGLMTIIFLIAAILMFLYLWEKASGSAFVPSIAGTNDTGICDIRINVCWTVGAILWASHPVITEQLYFSLQSMEVCFSTLLTAAALICMLKWQEGSRAGVCRALPFIACLMLLVSFSTYQSFVELFIFGTVSVVLLKGLDLVLSEGDEISAGKLIRLVIPYFLVFLIAFAGNMVLTRLFFAGSSYLNEQIEWGSAPVSDILVSILRQIAKTFTGIGAVHYDITFGMLTIFTIGLFIVLLLKHGRHKKGSFGIILFFLASVIITPYLLLIICGGNAAVRSQLVLPALTALYAYTDINICFRLREDMKGEAVKEAAGKSKIIFIGSAEAIILLVCIFAAWRQTKVTEALYYTEKMCYEQDVSIARELINKIDEERGHNWYPVIFIGTYDFKENHACIVGETIGRSFFEHDADAEPRFYWSTRRALGLMHVLGYNYEQVVDPEMIAIAMEDSKYMPEWPNEGCVQVHDDMIIVKMSNFEE